MSKILVIGDTIVDKENYSIVEINENSSFIANVAKLTMMKKKLQIKLR